MNIGELSVMTTGVKWRLLLHADRLHCHHQVYAPIPYLRDVFPVVDRLKVHCVFIFLGAIPLRGSSIGGEGSGPIRSEITCTGREEELTECIGGVIGATNCHHRKDAGVRCQGKR